LAVEFDIIPNAIPDHVALQTRWHTTLSRPSGFVRSSQTSLVSRPESFDPSVKSTTLCLSSRNVSSSSRSLCLPRISTSSRLTFQEEAQGITSWYYDSTVNTASSRTLNSRCALRSTNSLYICKGLGHMYISTRTPPNYKHPHYQSHTSGEDNILSSFPLQVHTP
jgi:hypothetical protein